MKADSPIIGPALVSDAKTAQAGRREGGCAGGQGYKVFPRFLLSEKQPIHFLGEKGDKALKLAPK